MVQFVCLEYKIKCLSRKKCKRRSLDRMASKKTRKFWKHESSGTIGKLQTEIKLTDLSFVDDVRFIYTWHHHYLYSFNHTWHHRYVHSFSYTWHHHSSGIHFICSHTIEIASTYGSFHYTFSLLIYICPLYSNPTFILRHYILQLPSAFKYCRTNVGLRFHGTL